MGDVVKKVIDELQGLEFKEEKKKDGKGTHEDLDDDDYKLAKVAVDGKDKKKALDDDTKETFEMLVKENKEMKKEAKAKSIIPQGSEDFKTLMSPSTKRVLDLILKGDVGKAKDEKKKEAKKKEEK